MSGTKSKVVILGAGRPYRASRPSALVFTSGNQRVLDWVITAFSSLESSEFHFVGGYRLDEIIRCYPHLHFSVNEQWASSGAAGSLLAAPIDDDATTYICYADILFTRAVVERLHHADGDVVVGVDRHWRHRFPERTGEDRLAAEKVLLRGCDVVDLGRHLGVDEADAEFAGVCKLSPRALRALEALQWADGDAVRRLDIPALLMRLAGEGQQVRAVDIESDWAELNEPEDLARFVLGTKAETLENLAPLVRRSVIGEILRFSVGEWRRDASEIRQRIRRRFNDGRLAVRSSTTSEDGWAASAAGRFESVLDVDATSGEAVSDAIEAVVRSYGDEVPDHQVLIQPMLRDVTLSGVLTTRTLNHGAPYYTLNFDDQSRATDTVTSGTGRGLRTLVVTRYAAGLPSGVPEALSDVVAAARELEQLVGYDALDIEFAVTESGTVHVLQLRPIAVGHGYRWIGDGDVRRVLEAAAAEFDGHATPAPHLFGRRTVYGIMPDWNPAEIIGTKPRRLALSLYRHLVTDEVWATQRSEYGYRDVRPQPLVMTFGGHPYVDVRASFNSFVPAALPDDLASRLVDHYLDQLAARPQLHDKIEFDIAFTCTTFDFESQAAARLAPAGFSAADIVALRAALLDITRAGIARCQLDLDAVKRIGARYERVLRADLGARERARLWLDDCRRLGTLPFAHLARGGFVAMSLLRSLEARGVLLPAEKDALLGSLDTVASGIQRDGARVASGEVAWETFVARYGHLRPGTYDITSERYDQDPERYLRRMVTAADSSAGTPPGGRRPDGASCWAEATRSRIDAELDRAGLEIDAAALEDFLRTATEGREYSKFVFTRNLSAALEALADLGQRPGLTRDELSHLSLQELLRYRFETPLGDGGADLERLVEHESEMHRISQVIELPPLILAREDFWGFEQPRSQPNFVTRHNISAPATEIDRAGGELAGRIVLIPQADPGFDWLFAHGIAGLITMYGGSNSHMTIRSAELDLPAAIGVGEALYQQLTAAALIDLHCGARQIRIVS